MLPALHAKAPARGLGWVQHGVHGAQARAASAVAAATSQIHELAPDVEAIIRRVHASKTKAVVYVTGGAVQSISWLLSVPGASGTVLEAAVPYSRGSLLDILGKEPEQYCSAATAAAMAESAYRRAANLCAFGSSFVGLGATCALATVDAKRGDHRAFVAVHSGAGSRCVALTLAKGERSRVGEDDMASRLLVKMLADSSGCDTSAFPLPLITGTPAAAATATAADVASGPAAAGAGANGSSPAVHAYDDLRDSWGPAADPLQRLLRGEVRCVEYCGEEVVVDAPRSGRVYLPGSFNPLHDGHRQLLATAVKAVAADGAPMEGAFELTVQNADKGLLPEEDIRRRVAQFVALGLPVLVTRQPLFTGKADLLPASRFVVGYDTAVRLVMPKYYNDSKTQMLLDFARLRQQRCSFLVAGRLDAATGRFMSLADVDVPSELADLFRIALPEDAFRLDISSTELRRRQQQQ